jgi:putative tricarboxylic transport membrane protein
MKLGPPEYFGLIAMGMVMVVYLSKGSFLKGAVMGVIGLILGCIGTDETTGKIRFAYGIFNFYDGIDIGAMVIGLFGVSEVLLNIGNPEEKVIFKTRVKNLLPSLQDWKRSIFPVLRGSALGFFLGIIPGGGTILSSFISYTVEKKVSKHPEAFGKGAIEGVAGPETANNAAVGGGFIPLFALGIPSNVVMAILLACFMIHGVTPGPGFIAKNQPLFWGIIASMYIGNMMLLILNLPLIRIWIKILDIPYRILFPLILLFCVVGSYSINGKTFDVLIMIVFGLAGYLFKKANFEPAPLALAFVLGPMFELSFRQTMKIASGKLSFFLTRPIALTALLFALLLIAASVFSNLQRFRKRVMDSVLED